MNDYEKYEADCEKIRTANQKLLTDFESWLKSSGLSQKTIKNHLSNVDFYINEYLLYEDAVQAKDGVHSISEFLGYWFIKKATWSSKSSIKANAASLKKFYSFLLEKGLIDEDDLNELFETIKEEMSEWLETVERYDDPSIEDMSDVWGL
ncbi:recombinase [Crocosphaera sp. Alani8]|uniref:recombinase n=1 Tax=Crocosphaera sp. Alani8 TaxID=3038952 RepID=UPI00313CD551